MAADPASILDRIPLYPEETEAAIRARWNTWANEGLDPSADADRWIDTRDGAHFQLNTEPGVREAARQYDRLGTEVVAASTPLGAWGTFLDDHGESRGLDRLPSTFADVTLHFEGVDGTDVAAGTHAAVPAADTDSLPIEFETSEGGTISGGVLDLDATAVVAGAAGNVAAAAIDLMITPVAGVTSVTNVDGASGGLDPETDLAYRTRIRQQYGGTAGGNVREHVAWALGFPGISRVKVIPLADGAGTVTVVIMGPEGEALSETVVQAYQDYVDPAQFKTDLTAGAALPAATLHGETTDGAKDAGFLRVGANGGQVVHYTGKTSNTFTGCTGGTGAVTDEDIVYQGGRGGGQAMVGQHVKVMTATQTHITVGATVEPEVGFSLDGFGGTVDISDAIVAALSSYVDALGPGDEIVYNKIIGKIADVDGVHDVGSVLLNGGAVNVTLTEVPPQAPVLDAPALVEGVV